LCMDGIVNNCNGSVNRKDFEYIWKLRRGKLRKISRVCSS